MPHLDLTCLGRISITLDRAPITRFRTDKARALFLYLAVENDQPHRRETLAGLFWGDQPDAAASHNLSQTLQYLQHTFGKENVRQFLHITRSTLQFRCDSDWSLDTEAMRELIRACEKHMHPSSETCPDCLARMAQAADLYQGEFLAHLFLDNCPEFEEWLVVKREYFLRHAMVPLDHLVEYYEQQGAEGLENLIRYARRQVELEAWREEPHRALMRAYAARGEIPAALAQYQSLLKILSQELGVEPSPETTALYKQLRASSPAQGIHLAATDTALPAPGSHLPFPGTPFVGRETELARLSGRMTNPDCRLLTLLGAGGMGKTRLAIELGRAVAFRFPRGVYFIDLADISTPELMPGAIATTLQFTFRGTNPPETQLIQYLSALDGNVLLLLDNFEPLLAIRDAEPLSATAAPTAVGLIHALLRRAPNVKLLVTSREKLNVPGEWIHDVEGLTAPAAIPPRVEDDWDNSGAVTLFVQSAERAGSPAANWSDDERRAAIRITQLVEGMPLAIELAAAWVRALTPAEIAAELERGLDILVSKDRSAPARHANIRAVFEYSWRLLTGDEQRAFARLSLFRGGLTRDAALAVAGASLTMLSSLVDKSLVKRTAAGRYRLHELLRQFAAEKLADGQTSNALLSLQQQHATYYLEHYRTRAKLLNAAGAQLVVDELRNDLDNLRQALRFAASRNHVALLDANVWGVAEFFRASSMFQAGVQELAFVVAQLRASSNSKSGEHRETLALQSKLLSQQARLLNQQARSEQARELGQQAHALAQDAASTKAIALAALYWGQAEARVGDRATARKILTRAVSRAHKSNLQYLEWEARTYLGLNYWNMGEYDAARAQWQTARQICRTLGNLRGEGLVLNNLGLLAQETGEFTLAREYLTTGLPLARSTGNYWLWANISANLGFLDIDLGAFDSARACFAQSQSFFQEVNDERLAGLAAIGLGHTAVRVGDLDHAEQILERATRITERVGSRVDQGRGLILLALLHHYRNQSAPGFAYAAQAIQLAERIGDRYNLAHAQLVIGHVKYHICDWDAATSHYSTALELTTTLQLSHFQAEARAGLARTALAQNNLAAALSHVQWILDLLEHRTLDGADEPFHILLTCFQVLQAHNDPRAHPFLHAAQSQLQTAVNGLTNPTDRQTFVQNIPHHRALSELM